MALILPASGRRSFPVTDIGDVTRDICARWIAGRRPMVVPLSSGAARRRGRGVVSDCHGDRHVGTKNGRLGV
jgi:hypothetical protein